MYSDLNFNICKNKKIRIKKLDMLKLFQESFGKGGTFFLKEQFKRVTKLQ